jgi:hypothetical protein
MKLNESEAYHPVVTWATTISCFSALPSVEWHTILISTEPERNDVPPLTPCSEGACPPVASLRVEIAASFAILRFALCLEKW